MGLRQSLTHEGRLTHLYLEVPNAWTKKVWDLKPCTSLVGYSKRLHSLDRPTPAAPLKGSKAVTSTTRSTPTKQP